MKYMRVMCEQESDHMIDFIEQSRSDILTTNEDLYKEQHELKTEMQSLCEIEKK